MTYTEIQALLDDDPDEVVRQCTELLNADPDDALALFLIGTVYARAERFGLAVNTFRRVVDLKPARAEGWNNLGMSLEGLHRELQAREAFRTAWGLEKRASYAANIAVTHLDLQEYRQAIEWARRALELDDKLPGAWTTLGMASLATGDWEAGWRGYGYGVGGRFRKRVQFADEPQWRGEPVGTLVVYGEQGLGDEVMYASCLEDVPQRAERVIVECDARLQGLFRRSFPWAEVHGTRRQDAVAWLEGVQVDASVPIGGLPEFCRPTPQSCPGTPYLVADPERRVQWRALLDSWGKRPKIGLAWTGGSRHNNPKGRAIGLEAFRPLLEAVDADWVSLQYRDPSDEIEATGLPVRHFARATLTDDYDDTAGLVAELDCVIGIHTSVHHLAGALGVRSLVLVPERSMWLYALGHMPWYAKTVLFRQRPGEAWAQTIERLIDDPAVRGL